MKLCIFYFPVLITIVMAVDLTPICFASDPNPISLPINEYMQGTLTPLGWIQCYNFTVPGSMDEGVVKVVMNYTDFNAAVCVGIQDFNTQNNVTTIYDHACESENSTQIQLCNGGIGNQVIYQTHFAIVVWCQDVCNASFGISWDTKKVSNYLQTARR